jgi:hypothetical protein
MTAWPDLPSVLESTLHDPLRARLEAGEGGPPPAPPWDTRVSAVLWWHRASPAALAHVPSALKDLKTLPITVGALVRYQESPVGSYSEVFASPVLLRRRGLPAATVPFIAVDSLASVVGGRAGWDLPKTLARALWPADAPARLETDEWSVSVGVSPATRTGAGPLLPLRGALPVIQASPDGGRRRSTVRLRGRARLSRADVSTTGPSLPQWLLSGRHPCLTISGARMQITAPERSD